MISLTLENQSSFPDGSPVSFSVSMRSFSVGRGSTMDWILKDDVATMASKEQRLSRKHFEVLYDDGRYWLKDTSTYGTFIEGETGRLRDIQELTHGMRLRVGRYFIRVDLGSQQASAPSVGSQAAASQGGGQMPPQGGPFNMPTASGEAGAPIAVGGFEGWSSVSPVPGSWGASPATGTGARPEAPVSQPGRPGSVGPVDGPLSISSPPEAGAGWIQLGDPNGSQSNPFPEPSSPAAGFQPAPPSGAPSASVQPESAPWPGGQPEAMPPQGVGQPSPASDLHPVGPWLDPPMGGGAPGLGQGAGAVSTPQSTGRDGLVAPLANDPDPRQPAINGDPRVQAPAPNGAESTQAQSELLAGIAAGLGLNEATLHNMPSKDLGLLIGACLAQSTDGIMRLLADRASVKTKVVRTDRTVFDAENDNPLKFAVNPAAAIEAILHMSTTATGKGAAYFGEALTDIRMHQAALISPVQKALSDLFDQLSPDAIEDEYDSRAPFGKRRRLWDMYCERWDDFQDMPDGILGAYLERYAEHYKNAIQDAKK